MPPEYEEWLGGVVPAWTVLDPGRMDALLGEPPFEDGAIHLAIDLTDGEIAQSAMLQNASVWDSFRKNRNFRCDSRIVGDGGA